MRLLLLVFPKVRNADDDDIQEVIEISDDEDDDDDEKKEIIDADALLDAPPPPPMQAKEKGSVRQKPFVRFVYASCTFFVQNFTLTRCVFLSFEFLVLFFTCAHMDWSYCQGRTT